MKEQERCSDCGNSGAVKTGEDEYLTCPCINDNLKIETMTSYQNTIMDLLKGKTPKAKHDYLVGLILDRDKFAIEFKDWCDKLSFMDKVTVHPIAGSGGGNGPRELTNSELLETYLRKLFHSQKQTQG